MNRSVGKLLESDGRAIYSSFYCFSLTLSVCVFACHCACVTVNVGQLIMVYGARVCSLCSGGVARKRG